VHSTCHQVGRERATPIAADGNSQADVDCVNCCLRLRLLLLLLLLLLPF
jgi:hypothetical protein